MRAILTILLVAAALWRARRRLERHDRPGLRLPHRHARRPDLGALAGQLRPARRQPAAQRRALRLEPGRGAGDVDPAGAALRRARRLLLAGAPARPLSGRGGRQTIRSFHRRARRAGDCSPRTEKARLQCSLARSVARSQLAEGKRGKRLSDGCNRDAPAWAGAFTRLPTGRQARPDLSTDKSGGLLGRAPRHPRQSPGNPYHTTPRTSAWMKRSFSMVTGVSAKG